MQINIPLGKEQSVKNLVFNILINEHPLKLIQLVNLIGKRYGKSVTFQAVRKAVLELVEYKVLVKKDVYFSIDKDWVKESKKKIDEMYQSIYEEKIKPAKMDSIGEEISVFTFSSLNEMMKFWQDVIDDWFGTFKSGDYNVNCYQGAHGWEGLLHPDREKTSMEQLKHKGIKSYAIFTSSTLLDRFLLNFYRSLGIKGSIDKSSSQFDRSYYVATYGDLVVQTQYPKELVIELDNFFKKNKKLENLNFKELSDIVNKNIVCKLSVSKNINMAKQINKSILSQIK